MQWLNEGLKNIWFPYTQMKYRPDPLIPVREGIGCTIITEDGQELIDGISSWWSACHGYSHPYIGEKIVTQARKLPHIMFAGLAHREAYVLANRLVNLFKNNLTSNNLTRVFFSDSGSTAVEVALKMAIQYFYNKGLDKKNQFISFSNSYHGDTAGCMSVSSACIRGGTFTHHIRKQHIVPISDKLIEFQRLIELHHDTIAGVIIEPILQGAGGMKMHSHETLHEIYRITKQYDVLFIADEIATGFYRLGKMFACDFANITPDIITLGKALTGGMCSLGATIATENVFDAFLSNKLEDAFMHGPTFMANPMACSAANASLDLFERDDYISKVQTIEQQLKEELMPCRNHAMVKDLRIKGACAAVEVEADWKKMFELRQEAIKLGVWLRPFADVIYLMPPLIIKKAELRILTHAVKKLLEML